MIQAIRLGVRRYALAERGNVAVLFGLAIIPIMLGVGVAIDYGRALTVRSHMAEAVDAAALAIGSWPNATEAELKAKAQQYFAANYPPSEIGTAGAINVSLSGDDIFISVSGSVPTTFMKLANINSVDVGVTTKVTKRERNIELALVLDTTGSMGQGGKMAAMQSAAKKLVQDLFKGKSTSDNLKIAVVPFSGAVNVGSDMDDESWIDKNATSDVAWEDFKSGTKAFDLYKELGKEDPKWKWAGCVREREGSDYELTDASPSSGASLFAPYLAPDEPDEYPEDHTNGNNYSNSYIQDGDCGKSKKSNRKPDACQRYTAKYDDPNDDDQDGEGPNWNCPPASITSLTNNQGQVISAIETLKPKGNTVIPAGLLWGWRVLSPNAPFTEGKPYDDEKWIKAIVLLTDGENMVSGGSNGHNESVYNAFGYAKEGHLGSTNGNNAESTLNSKLATVCSNVKGKDIQVYTIGFQLNNSTTQNLLKNCATKPDMYYNSPSNDQLASVFKDIAQGLGELRIAQ